MRKRSVRPVARLGGGGRAQPGQPGLERIHRCRAIQETDAACPVTTASPRNVARAKARRSGEDRSSDT
jgi:hypothetical protein